MNDFSIFLDGTVEKCTFCHPREACPREGGERGSSNFKHFWIPACAGMTFFNRPQDNLAKMVGKSYVPPMKTWGSLLATGLLMGLAFTRVAFGIVLPDFGWIAWIGLVPLVYIIDGTSPRRAFFYGWITASLYMYLSSFWLWETFQVHGGLGFFPTLLGTVLISLLAASFIGGTCALGRFL